MTFDELKQNIAELIERFEEESGNLDLLGCCLCRGEDMKWLSWDGGKFAETNTPPDNDPAYKLASSVESGDGFGMKLFVRRPKVVDERIANLSDQMGPNYELSPREKAGTLFYRVTDEVMGLMRKQAAELDPVEE
jgi:hypothetical protein